MKELYRFKQFLTESVTADEIASRVRKLGKEKGIEDKYIEDYIDELDGNFEPDAYENSTDKDLLDDLKSYIDLSEGKLKEDYTSEYDPATAKRNFFAASYNRPGDTERFRNYMEFLSKLKISGKTNMLGAVPYLQAEFNLEKKEAKDLLAYWMGSYRNPDLDEAKAIGLSPGKMEMGDDGKMSNVKASNSERKMAMRSVIDILKAELDVSNDDALGYIRTHRDDLFDGTVDAFSKDEVVDDYNEYMSVNMDIN